MVNVLLDTQVFFSHGFHFDRPEFKPLKQLVGTKKVRVLITKIIDREVRSHLIEQSIRAQQELRKVVKHNDALRHSPKVPFDVLARNGELSALTSIRLGQWEEWKKECGVATIPTKGIDIDSITDAYFDVKPPFGQGLKNHEFPDAITLAAARQWALENHVEVSIVSDDHGVAEFCKVTPRLTHFRGLASFLEQFTESYIRGQVLDALQQSSDVLEIVKREFSHSAFDVKFEESEVDKVSVNKATLCSIHVPELARGAGVVEMEVNVEFTVTITRDDPGSGIWDDEGYCQGYGKHTITFDTDVTIFVAVYITYNEDRPREVAVDEVSFDQSTIYIKIPSRYR